MLLIGPRGVFVIETKTRRKPNDHDATITYDGNRILIDGIPANPDPHPQARAAAVEIRNHLKRTTARTPHVRAVVLFPGWYVESTSGSQVWVLNPLNLAGWLRYERTPELSSSDLALLTNGRVVR